MRSNTLNISILHRIVLIFPLFTLDMSQNDSIFAGKEPFTIIDYGSTVGRQ